MHNDDENDDNDGDGDGECTEFSNWIASVYKNLRQKRHTHTQTTVHFRMTSNSYCCMNYWIGSLLIIIRVDLPYSLSFSLSVCKCSGMCVCVCVSIQICIGNSFTTSVTSF